MNKEGKLKWAILTSRWGRNASDLIGAYDSGKLEQSEISLLIYDGLPCGAADAADKAGVEKIRVQLSEFEGKEAYQQHLMRQLVDRDIDYVLLLSFKYLVRKDLLQAFPNRIINIHPSLFPSFLNTHRAIQEALEYGVKVSGITTHIIDDQVDAGTIVCQEPIRFDPGETFETVYPKYAETAKKILLDTIAEIEKTGEKRQAAQA